MKMKKISLLLLSAITMLLTACNGSGGSSGGDPSGDHFDITYGETRKLTLATKEQGFDVKINLNSVLNKHNINDLYLWCDDTQMTFNKVAGEGSDLSSYLFKVYLSQVGEFTIKAKIGNLESDHWLVFTMVEGGMLQMECSIPDGYCINFTTTSERHTNHYSFTRVGDDFMAGIDVYYKKQYDRYVKYYKDSKDRWVSDGFIDLTEIYLEGLKQLCPEPITKEIECEEKVNSTVSIEDQQFTVIKADYIFKYSWMSGNECHFTYNYYSQGDLKISLKTSHYPLYDTFDVRNAYINKIETGITEFPVPGPTI